MKAWSVANHASHRSTTGTSCEPNRLRSNGQDRPGPCVLAQRTHARTHVSPRVEPDLFSNAEVTRWLEGDGVVYLALLKIGRFSRSNESGREKPPTTMNRGRDENLEEGLHGERKTGGKKPAGQKLGMVVRSTRSKAITRDEEEKCMATVDKMTVICGVTITRRVQMVTP